MRIIAVLTIAGLLGALYAALRAKSRPNERPWLPALIVAVVTLGLASCIAINASISPGAHGVDVGDPGRN